MHYYGQPRGSSPGAGGCELVEFCHYVHYCHKHCCLYVVLPEEAMVEGGELGYSLNEMLSNAVAAAFDVLREVSDVPVNCVRASLRERGVCDGCS